MQSDRATTSADRIVVALVTDAL
ncbi:MAG: hypothetical protein QOD91_360, partial [Frankiales bacterium]|nr:hypothetical protein [Frankiales bacterium]